MSALLENLFSKFILILSGKLVKVAAFVVMDTWTGIVKYDKTGFNQQTTKNLR